MAVGPCQEVFLHLYRDDVTQVQYTNPLAAVGAWGHLGLSGEVEVPPYLRPKAVGVLYRYLVLFDANEVPYLVPMKEGNSFLLFYVGHGPDKEKTVFLELDQIIE